MTINQLLEKYKNYAITMRREFHMNPEPSMKEFRTQKRVMEELKSMGIPCEKIAGTGVIGTIKGNGEGKTVALRADMDALELQEENDFSYKSKIDGLKHGCGHDGHTAGLLTAAKILSEMKSEFKGTVKLLFQPGWLELMELWESISGTTAKLGKYPFNLDLEWLLLEYSKFILPAKVGMVQCLIKVLMLQL